MRVAVQVGAEIQSYRKSECGPELKEWEIEATEDWKSFGARQSTLAL